MPARDKHSSFLSFFKSYVENIELKGAYLSGAPFRFTSLGLTTCLTLKHKTMLEMLVKENHSSLMYTFAGYDEIFVENLVSETNVILF